MTQTITVYQITETIIDVSEGREIKGDTTTGPQQFETMEEARAEADRLIANWENSFVKWGVTDRFVDVEVVPVELGYANNNGYSDVDPFEIVRVVSDKTIEVRQMSAKRADDWKPEFIPGGFFGHCTNNGDQRKAWVISSDDTNPVIRIRKQKNGAWRNPGYGRFSLSATPVKHYDYNF